MNPSTADLFIALLPTLQLHATLLLMSFLEQHILKGFIALTLH